MLPIITRAVAEWLTHWRGSLKVWDSIPGCATKIVRFKNLAINIGDCVSLIAQIPCKIMVPYISGESSPSM